MEFCPKCGAVLIAKRKNYGCPRCSYSSKGKVKLMISEKIEGKKKIAVINQKDTETHPITAETCKKCNNPNSFFWTIQTRSGDEAETKFFKCTKCSHTWRDYR